MKKITSLILAMAMVFSLSAQVFALNDDMQDNENSEANMIVITTSKEERDKQFNDAMAKVMEQLEGPTLTRDNKERFKYEHFDYQYKTLKGYAGNQLSGGYKFPTGGGFYFSDSGGPNVSGSVSLSLPAPYNFVSISVGLGNRSTTSGLYVTVPNKTDYFKLYVEKEMEVRPYAIYKQNKHTREYELYDVGAVSVLYKLSAYAKKVGKPIYCISKEAIDEGNICLDKMSDPWFLDADYKAMALIEGKNIKA